MKGQNEICKEYQIAKGHGQKNNFCHSIDTKGYTIMCKDFFADQSNSALSVEIAEECLKVENEAESLFLKWLLQ